MNLFDGTLGGILLFVIAFLIMHFCDKSKKKKKRESIFLNVTENKLEEDGLDNDLDDPEEDTDEESASSQVSRSFSLQCENCGSSLELNFDHLMAFCPYCGNKLLIDVSQLGSIVAAKEKTKREEQKTERERERTLQQKLQHEYNLERIRIEAETQKQLEQERAKTESKKEFYKDLPAVIIFGILVVGFLIFAVIVQFN